MAAGATDEVLEVVFVVGVLGLGPLLRGMYPEDGAQLTTTTLWRNTVVLIAVKRMERAMLLAWKGWEMNGVRIEPWKETSYNSGEG